MLRNVLGPNTDCFLLIWFHHMLKIAYFSLCPCFSLPFLPSILCSAISISWCLLFFSCNQTHRFISVALRHYLNQFPSPFPSWRAAVRVGTLHLGTHLYTYAQTLSVSFTHTVTKAHRQAHIRCTQVQTHSYRWFTTSLFSNVLLASSLQRPFVTADRSWQQHLSILPLSSLCQPTLCFPQLWPPPPELGLFLSFRGRSEDRTKMVAILMQGHVFRWRLALMPVFNPNMGLWIEQPTS